MKSNKDLFEDPHKIKQIIGKTLFVLELNSPKEYPSTSVALSSVASTEFRDDIARRSGNDDYSASVRALFNSLDVFIKEFTNGTSTAGFRKNYRLTDDCEATLLVLWQLRNCWTHSGNVVDAECQRNYEAIMKSLPNEIKPVINLPCELEIGKTFFVDFETYKALKKCLLLFIERRVTKEDFQILNTRAAVSNIKFSEVWGIIRAEGLEIGIDLREALAIGKVTINKDGSWDLLELPEFDFESKRIIFPDGQTVTGRIMNE
jgi:hypothetical protein